MYYLFLGNVSFTLMLAVTAVVVGRILGPDGYGLYTVALIVPQFVFLGVRLGLDSAATRFAARLRSEGKEKEAASFVYVASIFVVVLAGLFAVLLVVLSGTIASGGLQRPQLGGLVLPIAMVSIVGQAAYSVTSLGLTGLGRFDRAALLQGLQGLSKLVVSPLLVIIGFGVAGAVMGFTASFLASGLLGIAFVLRGGGMPAGWTATLREGLGYGFPIYLSTITGGFVGPAINTVLALTVSNTEIGGYAIALNFTTLIALFTYPIGIALFPLFSRKTEDLRAVAETYGTSVRFTALFVVPVTVYIMAFSGPLIETFLGGAYSFGAPYLVLLGVMNLPAGLGSLAWSPLLNGRGHTKEALLATLAGSVASVIGAVALVGEFGVAGVIAGQILGVLVSLALGTWRVGLRLGVTPRLGGTLKVYGGALVAGALTWPLSWIVAIPQLSAAIGAVSFVLLLVPVLALFRTLDGRDLNDLRAFLSFSDWLSGPLEAAIRYYSSVHRLVWPGAREVSSVD